MMGWSPVVKGLHIGELVELRSAADAGGDEYEEDEVSYGQITEYLPDVGKFSVTLVDTGATLSVDPESLTPAAAPTFQRLGFDALLGPRTERAPLGETMASCLAERGFCVVRAVRKAERHAAAVRLLKDQDLEGKLGRLAAEVEEGYLGTGGRAKVTWLDPDDDSELAQSSPLAESDAAITSLADLLQTYAEDALGVQLDERTAAMACVSLADDDEGEYESPALTDQMIEEFYSTWSRAVLRVVHVVGPEAGRVSLTPKQSAPLTGLEESVEISAPAGTVMIVREDTYDYVLDSLAGGEVCWLQSFIMKQGPQWTLGDVEGDMGFFEAKLEGPPPPSEFADNLVAVVGMSLQAGGKMTDHEKEWMAYLSGCDGQMEMPLLRFDYRPYYNDDFDNPYGTYVKHFSVQEGIELFDNKVFEISNAEAAAIDPLCRQVMEVGYLSVLQIGITKKYCNTNPIHASVSVGCDKQEWLNMPDVPKNVAANNQLAICANRFNYVFNLKGGSYVMDTACSSSLCAGHMGKMNLLERRWDPLEWHLGLGAGVTLTVACFFGNCASHMLSPSGRCLTFNSTANGYNRGDGTSAMLIKAGVNEAERICYWRGSQVGQDGRSASMAAPNGPAQEKCTWGAMREAQMTPPESTVWECHGTGTSLGDPIEVGAVRKVQIKMKRVEPLMLATSKSNFGHLEGSAAQLAMNKCILTVTHLVCCPTQHLKTLNPHLDHAAFDAIFVSEHLPYKYKQGHCQVSSFGVGGTNGHAIFWGKADQKPTDFKKAFLLKMTKAPPPILRDGLAPEDWEYRGASYDAKPGDKYRVILSRDPVTMEEEIRYEREVDTEEVPEFYSITGSFNDWSEDRMLEGDVADLFYAEVTVPEDGLLEFRILADGDIDQAIGPEVTTSRKTVPIVGPKADHRTSWTVKAEPGSSIMIEFVAPAASAVRGMRAISWFPVRDE